MTDFYSQRLDEHRQTKEARFQPNLPLQKPNTQNGVGTGASDARTMAGKPADPNAEPTLPDSVFKQQFDTYSKDDSFKQGMKEFATIMQSMKKEMNGVQLPPEIMRKRVEQVINQYKQGSQRDSLAQASIASLMPQGEQNGL